MAARRNRNNIWGYFEEQVDEEEPQEDSDSDDGGDSSTGLLGKLDFDDMVVASSGTNMIMVPEKSKSVTSAYGITLL